MYNILAEHHLSNVILLNKAIAAAYAIDRETALRELEQIKGLENNYLYNTALGEVNSDLGCIEEARTFYEKALLFATSVAERALIRSKIDNCQPQ